MKRTTAFALTVILFPPALAAASPAWPELNGRDLTARAAHGTNEDACPSGMFRFRKDGTKFSVTIGAAFRLEWSEPTKKETESVPGGCTTTFESAGSATAVRQRTTRAKCPQKVFDGTEDESLALLDESTIEYRRVARDAKGEARATIACRLQTGPLEWR